MYMNGWDGLMASLKRKIVSLFVRLEFKDMKLETLDGEV